MVTFEMTHRDGKTKEKVRKEEKSNQKICAVV